MEIALFGFFREGFIVIALAINVFFLVVVIMLFRFLLTFPQTMKNLPD